MPGEKNRLAKQHGDKVNTDSMFGQLVSRFTQKGGGLFGGAVRAAKQRKKRLEDTSARLKKKK